jgi:hypothetical protein
VRDRNRKSSFLISEMVPGGCDLILLMHEQLLVTYWSAGYMLIVFIFSNFRMRLGMRSRTHQNVNQAMGRSDEVQFIG